MAGRSPRAASSEKPVRRGPRPPVVMALVLALVAIVFIAQNRDRVSINLLWATLSAPQWLLLTFTALIGVAVGGLLRGRR
jgi:uncharacterized integral membrane protein